MELASLPTTGVKIQLRNLYFYLCSEDPFLIPFSCGAICVGVSRQCLKNVHFQQTSSPGSMSFTWLPGPPPPWSSRAFLQCFCSWFAAAKQLCRTPRCCCTSQLSQVWGRSSRDVAVGSGKGRAALPCASEPPYNHLPHLQRTPHCTACCCRSISPSKLRVFPVLPRPQLALQLSLAGCSLCRLWAGASQGRMEPSCHELSCAQPALHPQKEMKPSQPTKGVQQSWG